MATETVKIQTGEGLCLCGCGEETKPKRQFRQGHDARLRGILGRAHKAGQKVQFGTETATTAAAALKSHGFPMPPAAKPKPEKAPKAEKATTAPKARKASTKRPAKIA